MIHDFAGDVGCISSIIIAEVEINYSKRQNKIVIYFTWHYQMLYTPYPFLSSVY